MENTKFKIYNLKANASDNESLPKPPHFRNITRGDGAHFRKSPPMSRRKWWPIEGNNLQN